MFLSKFWSWLVSLPGIWSRSLQFRTLSLTLVFAISASLISGLVMSWRLSDDLFSAKLDQVLAEGNLAANSVTALFNSTDATDETELLGVTLSAMQLAASSAPSANSLIAILRNPDQETQIVIQDFYKDQATIDAISAEIRQEIYDGAETQLWQSSSLTLASGTVPAIVVAYPISIGPAGEYGIYMVFSLGDTQQSLSAIQNTIIIGSLITVFLLFVMMWVLLRAIVKPIRQTARIAQKLSAGELDVRVQYSGETEIATLGKSFNTMAERLQERINELAELSTMQQRFVSDVSHELRTPLTTIRLAGDLIYDARGGFSPDIERSSELLHREVLRFESLLGDLLEITRFDAGAVKLDLEPMVFAKLVEETVEGVTTLAKDRETDIEVVVQGGLVEAEIDSRRVKRVLRNLLHNAIEHGESKPITVTVDSNEGAVAVAVRDHGVGLAAEHRERVFERFWRADPSRQRQTGGSGLGLAISAEDASLHGGKLEVYGEIGLGTLFVLTIPRSQSEGYLTGPIHIETQFMNDLPSVGSEGL